MKPIPQVIRDLVASKIVSAPHLSYPEIGKEFGICSWMVCKIATDAGLKRKRGPTPKQVTS